MDLVQAVVLGLLQGVTEWLPISSQGNTIIAAVKLFGLNPETAFSYSVLLHSGTMLAALIYFRKEFTEIISLKNKNLLKFILIALAATGITGIPLYLFVKSITGSGYITLFIGLMLLVTGILQWKKKQEKTAKENNRNAFILGIGQGISVLPGISRSGITTTVLLFEGFSPEKAFRLSFLLSVPAVFLAEVLFGLKEGITFEWNLLLAIAIAFVSGYISIKYLIEFAKKINFSYFCFAIGIFYIIISFL
ncbi:MAG: undecaprenyl-diphosphate phosphatase [archaeon]